MSVNLTHAMVFAAGLGTRMLPLTEHKPKPMIEIRGQPLLGHALDKIAAAGIGHTVVNTFYKPEAVEDYLSSRIKPLVNVSRETTRLETGGGVRKALDFLGHAPFLGVNADILWQDGAIPAITRLADYWDADRMDVLLLLMPKNSAWGHDGPNGDYELAADGQIRRLSNPDAPYLYAGLQITRPDLYRAADLPAHFSNLLMFDRAERAGRLYGLVHDSRWYHFSTPEAVDAFQRL